MMFTPNKLKLNEQHRISLDPPFRPMMTLTHNKPKLKTIQPPKPILREAERPQSGWQRAANNRTQTTSPPIHRGQPKKVYQYIIPPNNLTNRPGEIRGEILPHCSRVKPSKTSAVMVWCFPCFLGSVLAVFWIFVFWWMIKVSNQIRQCLTKESSMRKNWSCTAWQAIF